MTTEQDKAWAGDFGNAYHDRSPGSEACNYELFLRAFDKVARFTPSRIRTALELGAGTGTNLRALQRLFPDLDTAAVEINLKAITALVAQQSPKHLPTNVWHGSVLDFKPQRTYDLVLTKGFLIHIAPEHTAQVYEVIHRAAARWILTAEYYNPRHVPIAYRGERDLLWKGDFAGDLLERYADLRLVDYGFVYRHDPFPQDDLTWFLLEKHQ